MFYTMDLSVFHAARTHCLIMKQYVCNMVFPAGPFNNFRVFLDMSIWIFFLINVRTNLCIPKAYPPFVCILEDYITLII